MQQEDILVLEPGGGKSQILARMVREAQVYSHILPYKVDLARIRKINPAGIILAGSREELSALDPSRLEELSELGIPVMDFQPEELETEKGRELIQDFLFKVCQLKANWNMENFKKGDREDPGRGRFCPGYIRLSGGVDSAVASALVHKAIGDQLICIFVDMECSARGGRRGPENLCRPI